MSVPADALQGVAFADDTHPNSGFTVGLPFADDPALLGRLAIDKTVDLATAQHGETLTYTVSVTNIGALSATNVVAVDTLPVGLTYVASEGDGSPSVAGRWPDHHLSCDRQDPDRRHG